MIGSANLHFLCLFHPRVHLICYSVSSSACATAWSFVCLYFFLQSSTFQYYLWFYLQLMLLLCCGLRVPVSDEKKKRHNQLAWLRVSHMANQFRQPFSLTFTQSGSLGSAFYPTCVLLNCVKKLERHIRCQPLIRGDVYQSTIFEKYAY